MAIYVMRIGCAGVKKLLVAYLIENLKVRVPVDD